MNTTLTFGTETSRVGWTFSLVHIFFTGILLYFRGEVCCLLRTPLSGKEWKVWEWGESAVGKGISKVLLWSEKNIYALLRRLLW